LTPRNNGGNSRSNLKFSEFIAINLDNNEAKWQLLGGSSKLKLKEFIERATEWESEKVDVIDNKRKAILLFNL
jgi:hypothetical protein